MKIKNIAYILFITVLTMSMMSCQKKGAKLIAAAEEANKECPISAGEIGEMTSITSDGKVLTLTFSLNENLVKVEQLKETPEQLKQSAKAMAKAATGETKELFTLLKEERAGLKIVYVGNKSGQSVSVSLTYDELMDTTKEGDNSSAKDNAEEMLQTQVKLTKNQMPLTIEKGLTITDINIKGLYVVYDVEVDEDLYSVETMSENADDIKASMMENLKTDDVSMRTFVKACKTANRGIAYCYIGNNSGEKCLIKIKADELN